MTDQQEKFEEEAIVTLANKIQERGEEDVGESPREQMSLIEDIAEISEYYDIPKEDRIDFSIAGLERTIERQKQQIISDFRETLESLSRLWE